LGLWLVGQRQPENGCGVVWRNKLHFKMRFQAAYPFIALICKWLGEMALAAVNSFSTTLPVLHGTKQTQVVEQKQRGCSQ